MASTGKWIEGLGPESKVVDAARRSLEPRLAAVVHALPMAAYLASHDIEHVHRLRVATRRATAALKLYHGLLAGKPARSMKKRLRKIRRAAGDARDLDVLADRLARDYGERVAPVVDLIAKERAAVQPAIVRVADRSRGKDRYIRRTAALLDSIRPPAADNEAAEAPRFREWAADQLAKVSGRFLAAMPTESSTVAELHQFRIRAKQLRYAIELVAPACAPELRADVYPVIEELQERLGQVQDHVAAKERFKMWEVRERIEALCEMLRELGEAEQRLLTDAVRDFHGWWQDERIDRLREGLDFVESEAAASGKVSSVRCQFDSPTPDT